MKSLLKIIRRYSLTVGAIILVILLCNAVVFLGIGYMTVRDTDESVYGRDSMERIGAELSEEEGEIVISPEGEDILKDTSFVWAMALDGAGRAVWEWRLPGEIKRSYTLCEVSSFSRWYLEDYPVRTWRSGDLLLVFGCDKERLARYDMLISVEMFTFIPIYMKAAVIANLVIILLFILCFGFRFYQSMRPVAEGIEKLVLGEAVDIPESGAMVVWIHL